NYFKTMGIPLKAGREFGEQDDGREMVVIINETMSRKLWGNENPVGQRIKIGPPENEPWLTVVGVVGDVKNVGLDASPDFATYEPHPQRPWSGMQMVVRTRNNPSGVASAIRKEISAIDKDILIFDVMTVNQHISSSVASQRFYTLVLGIFAVL